MKLSPQQELEGRLSMIGFNGTEENLDSARAICNVLDREIGNAYKNAKKPEEMPRSSLRLG